MWERIPTLLQECADEQARLIIFHGEGGAFAAGADLTELAELTDVATATALWNAIRTALNTVASFPLPTIAMISGAAMGGGCLLACACDVRIADTESKFSVPVAQLGILLDEDNISRIISLVGRGVASEMLFASTVLSAERALQVGLVNQLVDAAQLKASALDVAERMKNNSAAAIGGLKRSIRRVSFGGLSAEEDQSVIVASYLTDDFRTRVAQALGTKRTDR